MSAAALNDIAAQRMSECEVSSDGLAVRLGFVDAAGRPCAIALPIECLSSLLMTLPALVTAALRIQSRDPSLRVVYPLETFRIESVAGDSASILTLGTPDGFEVSFSVRPETTAALHTATEAGCDRLALLQ